MTFKLFFFYLKINIHIINMINLIHNLIFINFNIYHFLWLIFN